MIFGFSCNYIWIPILICIQSHSRWTQRSVGTTQYCSVVPELSSRHTIPLNPSLSLQSVIIINNCLLFNVITVFECSQGCLAAVNLFTQFIKQFFAILNSIILQLSNDLSIQPMRGKNARQSSYRMSFALLIIADNY